MQWIARSEPLPIDKQEEIRSPSLGDIAHCRDHIFDPFQGIRDCEHPGLLYVELLDVPCRSPP
jgi:hypothetical protein